MEEKINKRERGANYTLEEKHLLADLIMQFKEVIEDKRTGGLFIKKKKEAWLEVANKYNSLCSSGRRSTDQLKALYDNMKQKARKKRISREGFVNKGEFSNSITTDTDSKILAILDQLDPLENQFDSGAIYSKDNGNSSSQMYCEPLNIYEPVISLGTSSNTGVRDTVKVEVERTQSSDTERDEQSADNSPATSIISMEDAAETNTASVQPNTSNQRKAFKKRNVTKMIPEHLLKHMTAEDLKKTYFKMKCENACLERKKIELELYNLKRENYLKICVLKKQLETLSEKKEKK